VNAQQASGKNKGKKQPVISQYGKQKDKERYESGENQKKNELASGKSRS